MTGASPDPQRDRGTDADERGGPSFTGQIGRVTGRRAAGGRRGWPAIDELSMVMPDGSTLEFGPPDHGDTGTLTGIAEIPQGHFRLGDRPCCPICLAGAPDHREHVPQENLGGRVMTWTCQPCNNNLGSNLEVDLEHWFDHALVDTAFEHDGDVPGRRRLPKMYYRENVESSRFALFVDGNLTPEVEEIMASGTWNMHWRKPDARRYKLALVKHAYLAACLHLREIADTPSARAIRADLLAARDQPRRDRPPESDAATALRVYRSGVGPQGPPLGLVAKYEERDAEPELLISLAGVLFVSWPFPDLPAVTWEVGDALGPGGAPHPGALPGPALH